MQYSFVRGAPSQPPLFTWESLHYLILELPPLRPSDSSSDSVVLVQFKQEDRIRARNWPMSILIATALGAFALEGGLHRPISNNCASSSVSSASEAPTSG